ncbi:MAG: 4Fe-4S dicluster domain-containing protein [Desulfobacterales bacterium]|nr:4Fe-4S dicluster domain-containing protein [Desulfobacterales bacterium]
MAYRKFIAWDARSCTGCRLCEAACSLGDGDGISPAMSAIRVEEDRIHVCRQCDPPACVAACPTHALDDGLPSDACLGCGLCVAACTHESIFQPGPKARPIKCDLCGGESPRCVAICPSGALALMGKGCWAALGRRVQLNWGRMRVEIGLVLKTRSNLLLLRMARSRIVRVRAGRPDTWLNRLVLTPMVKPFEKIFHSSQEKQ